MSVSSRSPRFIASLACAACGALSVGVVGCGSIGEPGQTRPDSTAARVGLESPPATAISASASPTAPSALPASAGRATLTDPIASPEAFAARVYAKTRFVWIRALPDSASEWIGYLWHGESVKLRTPGPVNGRGCGAWYAIVPRGYVCVDGKRATLDPTDPQYVEVKQHLPNYQSPSPHHYAESMGAERYGTLPDPREQRVREPGLKQHLARVELARSGGKIDPTVAGLDLTPAGPEAVAFASLPVQIQIPRRSFRRDSAMAYVGEYAHGNRSFLLTSDFAWVPKDRTRPYAPSTFHGVALGAHVKLPLAFFREHDRPAYRKSATGDFERGTEAFSRLGWVALTGRTEVHYPMTYLETVNEGVWVLSKDAVVPVGSTHTPWGARVGAPDTSALKPRGRATWVESSVYGGWLIAYEGTVPLMVTLIAPGRGGVASPPQEATKNSSTPTGKFVISGKFITATMDADDVTHADVPWVQNFSGPHSIHSAYWHDAWGERVSGGCLNVSPTDGRWLFEFSDPKLPEGWHGVRWNPRLEPATVVLIHR